MLIEKPSTLVVAYHQLQRNDHHNYHNLIMQTWPPVNVTRHQPNILLLAMMFKSPIDTHLAQNTRHCAVSTRSAAHSPLRKISCIPPRGTSVFRSDPSVGG